MGEPDPCCCDPSVAVAGASQRGGARQDQGPWRQRFGIEEQWRGVGRWPGTAFSFVEAAGVAYLGQLSRWLKPSRRARVLAQILNEPAVRSGLAMRGIKVPDDTVLLAALHNTTTDEIEGFDLDLLPPTAQARWTKLQAVFAQACDQVRRERAPRLGLDPRAGNEDLPEQLRQRANDGAETRPEWGLAGNAAFIIAPRQRSLGTVLDGRCFLHDYDAPRRKVRIGMDLSGLPVGLAAEGSFGSDPATGLFPSNVELLLHRRRPAWNRAGRGGSGRRAEVPSADRRLVRSQGVCRSHTMLALQSVAAPPVPLPRSGISR